MTDACKKMFQSLLGSLLNHLFHYANKNVFMKPLSLLCITSVFFTIYSLKHFLVYGGSCRNVALNHQSSFEKNVVKF